MKFHHVAVFVSDLDAALRMWIDLLGFEIASTGTIPTPADAGDSRVDTGALDEMFGVTGASSRYALLKSEGGAMIELQQTLNPKIQRTPPENLRAGHSGIHEIAFLVDDIEGWFERVRAAGYETTTKEIWAWAGNGKSFLFYDPDGNQIQFNQQASGETPAWHS
jgi:catechol 2,3-dioxygenase-like lactoylglutathione lyase family enzyme